MDYGNCNLCPRRCGVDRTAGQRGFCGCPDTALVAKAMLHKWEEPALAGAGGSGAVFFGGCTLRCRYCQNAAISGGAVGKATDSAGLRQLFEDLIAQGAENIDLVTPTHFLPTILPALRPKLPVPVVYNCGGYERVETLRVLEGCVDIYLPDLKYADARLAGQLSGAADYFPVAADAIREMVRQVGAVRWEGGEGHPGRHHPPPDPARKCGKFSAGAGLDRGEFRPRGGAGEPDAPVHAHGRTSRPLRPPGHR